MKNSLYTTIFIIALGALCHFGLPWWAMAPIGFAAALLFPQAVARSFGIAFAAGFLLWYASALLPHLANGGILSGKIGQLFLGLKGWQLLSLAGLLGGLLTGMGALTGALLRDVFMTGKPKRYRGKRTVFIK